VNSAEERERVVKSGLRGNIVAVEGEDGNAVDALIPEAVRKIGQFESSMENPERLNVEFFHNFHERRKPRILEKFAAEYERVAVFH